MGIEKMPASQEEKRQIAAEEFANMVNGHAVGFLEDLHSLDVSFLPPVVIFKSEIPKDALTKNLILKVPFHCSCGEVIIYISSMEKGN